VKPVRTPSPLLYPSIRDLPSCIPFFIRPQLLNRDKFGERLEAFGHHLTALECCAHTVEQRQRRWRGIVWPLIVLALMRLPLRRAAAREEQEQRIRNLRYQSRVIWLVVFYAIIGSLRVFSGPSYNHRTTLESGT